MNGLNQVRDAVIQTLKQGGLTAVPARNGPAKQYTGPVTAVDVAEASSKAGALCSYLGERWDEKAGTVRELYGRRLELSVALDVRAAAAADCVSTMESVAELLMTRLPSGIRCGEQSWEAVSWDRDHQLFLRRGKLRCQAYFTAEAHPESGTLSDFVLKGVITS